VATFSSSKQSLDIEYNVYLMVFNLWVRWWLSRPNLQRQIRRQMRLKLCRHPVATLFSLTGVSRGVLSSVTHCAPHHCGRCRIGIGSFVPPAPNNCSSSHVPDAGLLISLRGIAVSFLHSWCHFAKQGATCHIKANRPAFQQIYSSHNNWRIFLVYRSK